MPVFEIGETLQRIETGRAAEVIPMLEHQASLFPTSVTVRVLLARAYEARGAAERALSEWQWAATLMPNSPVVREGIERCIRALAGGVPAAGQGTAGVLAPPVPKAVPIIPPPEVDEFVDLTEQPDVPPDLIRAKQKARPRPRPVPAQASARRPTGSDEEFEDLDRLIAELESARITPDPDFHSVPPPDLEDEIDDMVSETLARIYAAQRQYDEAARVFELLAAQQPQRAREFMAKAAEMRGLAAEE